MSEFDGVLSGLIAPDIQSYQEYYAVMGPVTRVLSMQRETENSGILISREINKLKTRFLRSKENRDGYNALKTQLKQARKNVKSRPYDKKALDDLHKLEKDKEDYEKRAQEYAENFHGGTKGSMEDRNEALNTGEHTDIRHLDSTSGHWAGFLRNMIAQREALKSGPGKTKFVSSGSSFMNETH